MVSTYAARLSRPWNHPGHGTVPFCDVAYGDHPNAMGFPEVAKPDALHLLLMAVAQGEEHTAGDGLEDHCRGDHRRLWPALAIDKVLEALRQLPAVTGLTRFDADMPAIRSPIFSTNPRALQFSARD